MPAKFVSLYSGCGGLDLGFHQAGFRCVAAFDHDKSAIATHNRNFDGLASCVDLSDVGDEIINKVRMSDLLIAGPPCQGFSTAGHNNPSDERNKHLLNVANVAAVAKPKIVVIENVRGLLSKHNGIHFQRVIQTLVNAGYKVTWKLIDASDFGVPQKRMRVVIIGSIGNPFLFNLETKAKTNLRIALREVDRNPDHYANLLPISSDMYHISKLIKPGQKLSNVRGSRVAVHTWEIPEVFGRVTEDEVEILELILRLRRQNRRRKTGDADPVPVSALETAAGSGAIGIIQLLLNKGYLKRTGHYVDLTNTFNGKYRRLSWDDLAPTVDTRFGQPRYFLHPDEHRGFSMREAARIQTFPDNFQFVGSETAAYRMIGNAVPPKFARAIAEGIKHHWGLA